MHIVFVFENFSLGGVERVSEQLIVGLKKLYNCPISIICERNSGELKARFNSIAEVYPLDSFNKFSQFKKLVNMLSPELVVFTKGGLSRYAMQLNNEIVTVAVQHVPIDLPQASRIKNTLRRAGAKILYPRLDHVICVSQGILRNLIELNIVQNTMASCIYSPVLDSSLIKQAQEDIEYQNYFVAVGRLHYQKGYDLLISSIKKVKLTCPSIKVVIIGDGPERSSLLQLIHAHDLASNIILHGSSDNPYKYIAKAKGILLSSRWEGLPTVLVEAAFFKTPIIAFDCRYGPIELTNNGTSGHLVNFLDTDAFAEKIILLNTTKNHLESPAVDDFFLSAATNHYYSLFKSLL